MLSCTSLRRAISAYSMFMIENKTNAALQGMPISERGKKLGEMYRSLSPNALKKLTERANQHQAFERRKAISAAFIDNAIPVSKYNFDEDEGFTVVQREKRHHKASIYNMFFAELTPHLIYTPPAKRISRAAALYKRAKRDTGNSEDLSTLVKAGMKLYKEQEGGKTHKVVYKRKSSSPRRAKKKVTNEKESSAGAAEPARRKKLEPVKWKVVKRDPVNIEDEMLTERVTRKGKPAAKKVQQQQQQRSTAKTPAARQSAAQKRTPAKKRGSTNKTTIKKKVSKKKSPAPKQRKAAQKPSTKKPVKSTAAAKRSKSVKKVVVAKKRVASAARRKVKKAAAPSRRTNKTPSKSRTRSVSPSSAKAVKSKSRFDSPSKKPSSSSSSSIRRSSSSSSTTQKPKSQASSRSSSTNSTKSAGGKQGESKSTNKTKRRQQQQEQRTRVARRRAGSVRWLHRRPRHGSRVPRKDSVTSTKPSRVSGGADSVARTSSALRLSASNLGGKSSSSGNSKNAPPVSVRPVGMKTPTNRVPPVKKKVRVPRGFNTHSFTRAYSTLYSRIPGASPKARLAKAQRAWKATESMQSATPMQRINAMENYIKQQN